MITQEILDAYEKKEYSKIFKAWEGNISFDDTNEFMKAYFIKNIILNDDLARLYLYMNDNSTPILWKNL